MITRLFLDRLRAPEPAERAYVVEPLYKAFLCDQLSQTARNEIICGLAGLIDDPSPIVRKALARAVAEDPTAPHHIVMSLARDQVSVAALVLVCSPVLRDFDLLELVIEGCDQVRELIAVRLHLSAKVASAIIDIAGPKPCITLLDNPTAAIGALDMARLAERHSSNAKVRAAMLARKDLPLPIRQGLTTALCDALGTHAMVKAYVRPERAERMIRETWERSTIELALVASAEDRYSLIAHLGASNQITASLLMRALVTGSLSFFEDAMAYLSRLPVGRTQKLVRDRWGPGFRALYKRANLPQTAFDGFQIALRGVLNVVRNGEDLRHARTRRIMLEGVLNAYQPAEDGVDKVQRLLTRLHDEAAREEVRSTMIEDVVAA